MLDFQLSADVLGNTRFAYSPLAEVASSVRLLGSPQIAHLHQPWLREVRPRLGDLELELLFAVAPPGRWAPDCLYLPSPSPLTTIDDQLRSLTELDPQAIAQDLDVIYDHRVPPSVEQMTAQGRAGLERLAEQVRDYWQTAIQPYWTRICGVLEEDVSYRAARSLAGGLFGLLADLHAEVSLNGNLLSIDKPHHRPARYTGAELTLTPSVFTWPQLIVSHSRPGKFELIYAARGVGRVWEGLTAESTESSEPLAALIGRSRAAILGSLSVPMSTTRLAHELGQSPGSISQHLSILRDSGMVVSWRSGRSVLYRRTPLATSILDTTQVRTERRA